MAEALAELSDRYSSISIGSYPWFQTLQDHGVALIARGTDMDQLNHIRDELDALVRAQGADPEHQQGEA